MLIKSKNVEEVIVGKNEAGLYEYADTGIAIEQGEKAFVVLKENIFSNSIERVFFKNRENAEKNK